MTDINKSKQNKKKKIDQFFCRNLQIPVISIVLNINSGASIDIKIGNLLM